ncbi:MAG: isopentenyl-diphosphate Delta-isomerase [Bacteroidota bacterium]
MESKPVILVDELDNEIGTMEKMEAHYTPHLHRAFSVFVFNNRGQMLLQQRAKSKYHSGGLWTNTCCSHPSPGEKTGDAATRRLQEEMGFTTELTEAFDFIYQAAFDNGLTEYEYDHVFIGEFEGDINPSKSEVENYCYKSFEEIKSDLQQTPWMYTEWFKIALPRLEAFMAGTTVLVA